jgi:hypothetical protein
MKRAQVTLFVMIGLVMMVVAALFFYAVDITQQRNVRVAEISSAKQVVEYCLDAVAEDALITVGKNGGFAEAANDRGPLNATYLADAGENKVPEPAQVSEELSDYIEHNLHKCIDGFSALEAKGIEVDVTGDPEVTAIIAESDVQFSVNYAIAEIKAGAVTVPEFTPVRKAVRLKAMLQLANDLVASEIKTGLFDLDVQCAFDVMHFPIDQTLLTVIADRNFLVQNAHYSLVFAHRK